MDLHEGPAARTAPALQVYGQTLQHKHVPEIQHRAGLTERPVFVPAYGAFRQGIVLTLPRHLCLLPAGTTAARLHQALQDRYAGHRHVQVMALVDSARCHTWTRRR